MATISRLSVSLTANTKGLRKGLSKAKGMVKGFTKSILNIKTAITGAFALLGAGRLASDSINAFQKQEQAVRSWQESIKSMGRTTKGLDKNIQKLATNIQANGIIGDEDILQGAAFLSTYGDITDDMLPRAIRAMVDLAAKTGGTTTNAAKLLGKASMGLVGALSIAGISLSDATKKSKDFGDILTEIEQQVGGINAALGKTASGALTQFGNAVGDVKESLGEILLIGIRDWLALFTQGIAGGEINVKKLGETLKSFINKTALAMADLVGIAEVVGKAWSVLTAVISGALGVIGKGVSMIGAFLNKVVTTSGHEPLFDQTTLDQMSTKAGQRLDQAQSDLISGFDFAVAESTRLLAGGKSAAVTEAQDNIQGLINDAAVAGMKQRLGIAGGPNFATTAAQKTTSRPIDVTDPQLIETNSKLDQMINIWVNNSMRAVAG